jgi:hypothetical protein
MEPRTILFGPRLQPSESWLKSALLAADQVSTIVPQGYESRGVIRWCEDANLWKPAVIGLLPSDKLEAAIEECLRAAAAFPSEEWAARGAERSMILPDKLPSILQAHLFASGQLRADGDDFGGQEWIQAASQDLIPNLLTICARHLAWDITDPQSVARALRADTSSRRNPGGLAAVPAGLISVTDVIAPTSETTLDDILQLRREHSREFERYMQALQDAEDLARIPTPDGAKDIGEVLAARIRELSDRAFYLHIPLGRRSRHWVARFRHDPTQGAAAAAAVATALADLIASGQPGLPTAVLVAANLTVRVVHLRKSATGTSFLRRAHAGGLM